jgi:hypothetical protein
VNGCALTERDLGDIQDVLSDQREGAHESQHGHRHDRRDTQKGTRSMSAASDREAIIHALCGGSGHCADEACELIGLALELAVAQTDALSDRLPEADRWLGYSLEGKLKALDNFIANHVDTALRGIDETSASDERSEDDG